MYYDHQDNKSNTISLLLRLNLKHSSYEHKIIKKMEERWGFLIYNEINSQARAKRLVFNLENQELCFLYPLCNLRLFFFF